MKGTTKKQTQQRPPGALGFLRVTCAWLRREGAWLLWLVLLSGMLTAFFIWPFMVQSWDNLRCVGLTYITAKCSAHMSKPMWALLLLLMCRNLLTWAKTTVIGEIFPVDQHVWLHKVVGKLACTLGLIHSVAHCLERIILTNAHKHFRCTGMSGLTQAQYWSSWVVISGLLLVLIMFVMLIFALNWPRRLKILEKTRVGMFLNNATNFWYSHQLFWLFILLLALHPAGRMSAVLAMFNDTAVWIAVPAAILIIDRFQRSRRSMIWDTRVTGVSLLPSNGLAVYISRPKGFNYTSGMYIFLRVPGLHILEWHPFTLTSAPHDKDELSILVRARGDWTIGLRDWFEELVVAAPDMDDVEAKLELTLADDAALESTRDQGRKEGVDEEKGMDANGDKQIGVGGHEATMYQDTGVQCELMTMGHRVPSGYHQAPSNRSMSQAVGAAIVRPGDLMAVLRRKLLSTSPSWVPPSRQSTAQSTVQRTLTPVAYQDLFEDDPAVPPSPPRSPRGGERNDRRRGMHNMSKHNSTMSICQLSDAASGAMVRGMTMPAPAMELMPGSAPEELPKEHPLHIRGSMKATMRRWPTYRETNVLPIVCVDGPYGAPAQRYKKYKNLLLIGAGVGVTPFISILKSILNTAGSGAAPRRVHLIWTVRDPDNCEWLRHLAEDIRANPGLACAVKLSMYVTQVDSDEALSGARHTMAKGDSRITLTKGRPNWDAVFAQYGTECRNEHIGVFYCGPKQLARDLRWQCITSSLYDAYFWFYKEVF